LPSSFFVLKGGLDLTTPSEAADPGRALSLINMICTQSGYQRAPGYERYDGHAKPSASYYWYQAFNSGSEALVATNVLVGATSARSMTLISDAVVTSGSYGAGTAAGYWILRPTAGDLPFDNGENVDKFGGSSNVATANSVATFNTAPTLVIHVAARTAEEARRRALIAAPTGTGKILGVFRLAGKNYCFRLSGGVGVLYQSSSSGWTALTSATYGYRVDFTVGAGDIDIGDTLTQGGVTGTIRAVVITSGSLGGSNAVGWLTVSNIAGGNYAAGAATTSGAGSLTVGGAQTAQTFADPGTDHYRVTIDRFSASASESAVIATVSDRAFMFDGTYVTRIPASNTVAFGIKFQNHLFVLRPSGRVTFLGIGDPFNSTAAAGAGDLYTGSYMHGAIQVSPDVLMLVGKSKIALVTGTSAEDFALTEISPDSGGYADTIQKMGAGVYADSSGLRSVYDVDTSAGFRTNTLSSQISPIFMKWERQNRAGFGEWLPSFSLRDRARDLYVMFTNGYQYVEASSAATEGLCAYFGRDPERPEWSTIKLGFVVSCAFSYPGEGDSVSSQVLLLGGTDGMVYEWGLGDDYDGSVISTVWRQPFFFCGAPDIRKRFLTAAVQTVSAQDLTLTASGASDIDVTDYSNLTFTNILTDGADEADFLVDLEDDTLFTHQETDYMQASIDAIGQSFSLVITSSAIAHLPFTIRSVLLRWSPRGPRRMRSS
jgi:hypothetical protein